MLPTTLEEVLDQLSAIVEQSIASNSRAGLFAYVYYRTTLQIKQAIAEGAFEDGERMERFDVVFANLYLQAYHDRQAQRPVSQAWQVAFEAEQDSLAILQHVMLGMNAHINLDLGIAASTIMQGQDIAPLEPDFMKVNAILASLVKELQSRIGRVSPLLFLLDWVGGRSDEQLINFSMAKARQCAWQLAQDLWGLEGAAQTARLQAADKMARQLGRTIIRPPGRLLPYALRFIQGFESKDTAATVQAMRS